MDIDSGGAERGAREEHAGGGRGRLEWSGGGRADAAGHVVAAPGFPAWRPACSAKDERTDYVVLWRPAHEVSGCSHAWMDGHACFSLNSSVQRTD